jgi:O-antigen biosynthesis alpha-1,3-rhamnosyltransferase
MIPTARMPLTVGYDRTPELIAVGGIKRYVGRLRAALGSVHDLSVVDLGMRARRRDRSVHVVTQGLLREGWWYTAGLDRRARAAAVDVVHCTAFAPEVSRRPFVLTVQDVIPLVYPELFTRVSVVQHRLVLARRARRAARVLTTTEQTRREIADLLGVADARIRVVPLAVDPHFRPTERDAAWLRERFGITQRYVLCVGTLEPRKNLAGALRGMEQARLGDEVALVVAGGRGWKNEAFERMRPSAAVPVILTGPVDDAELVRLYGGAACLLYPSLYEGFGLPPLEAMACGCPAVVSDRSGLPERVGGGGLTVDPDDPASIAGAIRTIVGDEDLRARLSRRALETARRFTWERTAAGTAEVYREAAADGPP